MRKRTLIAIGLVAVLPLLAQGALFAMRETPDGQALEPLAFERIAYGHAGVASGAKGRLARLLAGA